MVDSIDIQILRELQKNARLTVKELAAKVSLSTTPVFERVKRLEKEGVIRRYIAVLDSEKLNKGVRGFLLGEDESPGEGHRGEFHEEDCGHSGSDGVLQHFGAV